MWIVQLEKKILKTLSVVLGTIILLAAGLHVYIINNAERLIEDIVKQKSGGKIRLELRKVKFNYFSNKIILEDADFYSADSADSKMMYSFKIKRVNLRIKDTWEAITKNKLEIETLALKSPEIHITRLAQKDSLPAKQMKVAAEMGRIYNSIIDGLKYLQVKKFEMDDGKFILDNKAATTPPLEITNLHLVINNKASASKDSSDNLSGEQMIFKAHQQSIRFPDGKHQLSFSRFRINIRKRLIEIDSCTLTGRKPGNDRARLSVFVDTLRLVNADFRSLYKEETIKADTLFFLKPDFKIDIQLRHHQKAGINLPNLDTVIQQLTGDLDLQYIGVKNAKLNINTYIDSTSGTSFSSDNNNFEMEGLSIDHNRAKPVALRGFSMAIHNYMNYLRDSSYFLRFDSILLRENKILLSNFSINTDARKDNRNIKVQQFGLTGISWSDFLFNRKIVADAALLYHPDISYTETDNKKKKNDAVLSLMTGKNNIIRLNTIKIIDGDINLNLKNDLIVQLKNTNLNLNSSNLHTKPSLLQTEKAVDSLSFSKGIFRISDLVIDMDNVRFAGSPNNLFAGKMHVYNRNQGFTFKSTGTKLEAINYNDSLHQITGNSISWEKANLEINDPGKPGGAVSGRTAVLLNNIKGTNTEVNLNIKNNSSSVMLDELSAKDISYSSKINFSNLSVLGRNLIHNTGSEEITAEQFSLIDLNPSTIRSFVYKKANGLNNINLKIPGLYFIPDIKNLTEGKFLTGTVILDNPELTVRVSGGGKSKKQNKLPVIRIDSIEINKPFILYENNNTGNKLNTVSWNGRDNRLVAWNIKTDKQKNTFEIDSLHTGITNIALTGNKKDLLPFKNSAITVSASNIVLSNSWEGKINEAVIDHISMDSIGKKKAKLSLQQAKLNDVYLSSENITNLHSLVTANNAYKIFLSPGSVITYNSVFTWQNIAIDKAAGEVLADSLSINPVMGRDAFIKSNSYQSDYINFYTPAIKMTGFRPDQYFTDSSLRIHDVLFQQPYFSSYRDKRYPFKAGIFKPLPTKLIQRIPFALRVDTIRINEGTTVYSEVNDQSNETGTINITHMSGDIFPVKNFDIGPSDSLRIRLNGYLLDTGWIRLRTRESYLDTLSGFLFTVRMKPHSLLYLNKVLPQLASVQVQSGFLDTLTMRAIARDNYSLGEMLMFYHDLKLQFLRNDKESKKQFLMGFKSFIANSLIIKNSNTKRKGIVYFPRTKDRSFINYYVKTFMSGIASAIGARSTKKMLRKYQKELKKRNLLSVEFD